MTYAIIAAMFVAAGLIHRLRGGLLYDIGIKIPGREFVWAAPLLGGLTYLATLSWELGAASALSMIIWSLIPHSRWWFCGGRDRETVRTFRPASGFESACEKVADTFLRNPRVSDFFLFALKHYVAAIPFLYIFHIAALEYIAIAIMISFIYLLVMNKGQKSIWLTETLAGMLMWGTPVLLCFTT